MLGFTKQGFLMTVAAYVLVSLLMGAVWLSVQAVRMWGAYPAVAVLFFVVLWRIYSNYEPT